MRRVAVALVHYPVIDRDRRTVTTAITNLDLHDIARSAHTYDLEAFYVVHPVAAQRELALKVREHWTSGSGARRIPDRTPALSLLRIVPTLDDAISEWGGAEPVELWTTSASAQDDAESYASARSRLREVGSPVLLLFGTGWGLADELYRRAARRLEPIRSRRQDGYNHLSVRAAAAISFDRLFAEPG
jgi:hypothetical protein